MSEADDDDDVPRIPGPQYVESSVIMATVRVLAPFVLTFGAFMMFHGADGTGGGFQGGVTVGTVVIMLGVAFGIRVTRDWVGTRVPAMLMGLGVLVFLGIGLGSVALGGGFLDYPIYGIKDASKYSVELVELAIGLIVAGVSIGLFFALAAGMPPKGGEDA
ncbi:MnhB domain-containing protein [Haloarchaeobius salinus]|uniref:MnhB domain-containing protein n=1 Tax=Haloarchaeobius salinus TaxID=1198298 RepID=UPI00210C60AA|nr:MnhB domain-containing protein [Haloarchaeobius salinus]